MGIFFALLSSIIIALGYILIKKSYEEFPPSVAFFLDVIFGLLIWIPFSLIIGIDTTQLPTVFLFAFISAILSEAFIFYIFSKGEISITGTIFASYPIYTILFSLSINHEKLTSLHWLFVLLTIIGTIIVSLPKKINKLEFKKKSYILWALAGATAVGLSDSLSKNIIDQSSAPTFLFALAITQLPIGLIYLKLEKQPLSQFKSIINKFNQYKYAIYGSFLIVIAMIFFWLAFEKTMASIASPLTATYPGIMIILAITFLKEKVTKQELIGLITIIIGIIGISYFY